MNNLSGLLAYLLFGGLVLGMMSRHVDAKCGKHVPVPNEATALVITLWAPMLVAAAVMNGDSEINCEDKP